METKKLTFLLALALIFLSFFFVVVMSNLEDVGLVIVMFLVLLLVYVFSLQVFYAFFVFIQYVSTDISRKLAFGNMTDEQIAEVKQEVEKNRFNWWVNLGSFWQVAILGLVVLLLNIYWWVFVFEVPTPS
jgi:hypothetical protein